MTNKPIEVVIYGCGVNGLKIAEALTEEECFNGGCNRHR